MRQGGIDPPELDELQCLSTYPEGTIGYAKDQEAVEALLKLCLIHGFGYIPQVASWIEDIWRNPENVKKYKKARKDRLRSDLSS